MEVSLAVLVKLNFSKETSNLVSACRNAHNISLSKFKEFTSAKKSTRLATFKRNTLSFIFSCSFASFAVFTLSRNMVISSHNSSTRWKTLPWDNHHTSVCNIGTVKLVPISSHKTFKILEFIALPHTVCGYLP